MTESTERWKPDDQLIPALLAGPRPDLVLSKPDRCWAVAGLTLAGFSAEGIEERIGLSVRLVRTIRADPMTQVCTFYLIESKTFERELEMAQSDYRSLSSQLNSTEAELVRTREQLNRLIGRTTFPKCGHPMDRYNTYVWTTKGGLTKRSCRTCHRTRQAERRANPSCHDSGSTGDMSSSGPSR